MDNRATGSAGERFAVEILRQKGMEILACNLYTPYGELDIVAADADCIAFVEVKTRRSARYGSPGEAVGRAKQRHMIHSAEHYLMGNPSPLQPRFDVFEIVLAPSGAFAVRSYEHIINAFEVKEYEGF